MRRYCKIVDAINFYYMHTHIIVYKHLPYFFTMLENVLVPVSNSSDYKVLNNWLAPNSDMLYHASTSGTWSLSHSLTVQVE